MNCNRLTVLCISVGLGILIGRIVFVDSRQSKDVALKQMDK